MKEIKAFEQVMEQKDNKKSLKELGINDTMFWAYRTSKHCGNELINFNDVINDYDVEDIVKTLKANNITEFTISSTFSGLVEILAAFDKLGVVMAGMTTVKVDSYNFETMELDVKPAIKMIIKEDEHKEEESKKVNRYTVKVEKYNEYEYKNPTVTDAKVLAETGEEAIQLLLDYLIDRIEDNEDLEVSTKTVMDNEFGYADFYPDEDSLTLHLDVHVIECEEGIEVGQWYNPIKILTFGYI